MPTSEQPWNDQREHALDLPIFESTAMQTDSGLEIALSALQANLHTVIGLQTVSDLLSKAHLFEFIYSTVDENTAGMLRDALMQAFPSTAEEYPSSVAAQAIAQLGLFLFFLPDSPSGVPVQHRSAELATSVLRTIPSLAFYQRPDEMEVIQQSEPEQAFPSSMKFAQTQRKSKRAKRVQRAPAIDRTPFQKIGEMVPSTVAETDKLVSKLLTEQKETLQCYLNMLRLPALSNVIRNQYIPAAQQQNTVVDEAPPSSVDPKQVSDVSAQDIPVAFPMVQPIKAALYFDSAEGFGEWRLLISTRAHKDLRDARKHGKSFNIIIKKLKELSQGHFSDDNQKRLAGSDNDIPIFEAKMTRDLRLVYQVDCMAEYDCEVERQVLRVFGIYTHAQLDKRFWLSMGQQLGSRGAEYRRRCTFRNRPIVPGDNLYAPASWPPQLEMDAIDPVNNSLLRTSDLEGLHSLLVLEKFIPFSQALLNSILTDQDVSHVFAVSEKERKIIEHNSSCYVLGRSGTGKTTTMLFKMLGIERLGQQLSNSMPKPRQLFVTQSRVLAGRVEEYFHKLMDSLAHALRSPEELAQLLASKKASQEEVELVDLDDDEDWRSDLPKRFSELEDAHFPLFLTFDQLCKLIEADLDLTFTRQRLTKEHRRAERRFSMDKNDANDELVYESGSDDAEPQVFPIGLSENEKDITSLLVSYDVFREAYWPHFPQKLTKGLDPALVYSEFMGVIKGSELSLASEHHFLERDVYLGLSHRCQSTFASRRADIYTIFETYIKKKRVRGDYDVADRTHAIIQCMRAKDSTSHRVDFLYVDEAQDNLLIDAQLLRYLCRNPHGLFWAGDTAQTISIGSSFRFNDLKAFLHRMEEERLSADRPGSVALQPKSFQLTMNYRSHGGIVNCADSVIDLITNFWPHSIDVLAKEKGIVDGLKPIFFTGWDQDTVRYEQFLFGESGNSVEFGARQCILVRSDTARERLRSQVGEIGLIMTLYESKGLEFDDVMLYNFFEDSSVDLSQWRVILNAVEWGDEVKIQAPRFEEVRHAGVCTELKFLYVAITRARKNLWIVDRSDKGDPMRVLWTRRNQVENYTPGTTNLPKLAESSTPQEWCTSGKSLFQNKRYAQAMHCFERASLPHEKSVANAYYLRVQAKTMNTKNGRQNSKQERAFVIAAEAFISCAEGSLRQKKTYLRIAGDCFAFAKDDASAAQVYMDGSHFTLAARHFRKAGMFDEAVSVIQNHREDIVPEVAENIIHVAKVYYFKERKLDKAEKLFQSYEDELEFMEDYGMDIARVTFLESIGRKAEAAELHLSEGRTIEAIRLFLKDAKKESVQRAAQCLLGGLWECLCLGRVVDAQNAKLAEFLSLARQVDRNILEPEDRDELTMFDAIAKGESAHLLRLFRQFHIVHKNIPATLLSLDHYLEHPPPIQVISAQELSSVLETYNVYAELLRRIVIDAEACSRSKNQKLLGFHENPEHDFRVFDGTLLYRYAKDQGGRIIKSIDSGGVISKLDLTRLIGATLRNHLKDKVIAQNEACRRARAFTPCLHFALYRRCTWDDCSREHIEFSKMELTWFNLRIKICFQQISFLQACEFVLSHKQWIDFRRHWLSRLFEAYHPPVFNFGSVSHVSPRHIPEVEKTSQVIGNWVQNQLYALNPIEAPRAFLTTILRSVTLGIQSHREHAHSYWSTAFYSSHRPTSLLRNDGKSHIVDDLLKFLEAANSNFISSGISFLRHVTENKEVIDINDLCHIIENLCGSIVIIKLSNKAGLHGLTLPRSWLLSLMPKLNLVSSADLGQAWSIVQPLAAIMRQLYSGIDTEISHMSVNEKRNISNLNRTIFIFRICRALCLVGYNIPDPHLRTEILIAITSLRKAASTFPPLYSRYVTATQWKHLQRAVQLSTSGSSLDELVCLIRKDRRVGLQRNFEGVRNVEFGAVDNIPSLLTFDSQAASFTKLTATAKPFTPQAFSSSATNTADAPVDTLASSPLNDEDLGETIEDENDAEAQDGEEEYRLERSEALDSGNATGDTAAPVVLPTEKEIWAVTVIETKYHALIRRRQTAGTSALRESRIRQYQRCYDEAQGIEWPHRYYRLLFLGPLPHILVCLEGIQQQIRASKEKAKKRLTLAEHQELEDVAARITAVNKLLKHSDQLKKALEPSSLLHRRRDLAELRTHVIEVQSLARELTAGEVQMYMEDLNIGVKGIVQEQSRGKAKSKPALNVDDLIEI